MFNAKFDLSRFNLTGSEKTMYFSRSPTEIVECVAGGRIYKGFSRTVYENFHSRTSMILLINASRITQERLFSSVKMLKLMLLQRDASEQIKARAVGSKVMFILRAPEDTYLCRCHLGKAFSFVRNSKSYDFMLVHAGKYLSVKKNLSEVISCNTSASTTTRVVVSMGITIPPGGEIRIDSDIFSAQMGLSNILHTYNGDWIFLNRDTVSISMDNGTGGAIAGELIYNERFI